MLVLTLALNTFISFTFGATPIKADSVAMANLKNVAISIKEVPNIGSNSTIPMPAVPKGYTATFISSDCIPVVSRSGKINPPLVDTKVHLYFVLKDSAGNKCDIPSIPVIIPGINKTSTTANAKPFVVPALREWLGGTGQFTPSKRMVLVVDLAHKLELSQTAEAFVSEYTAMFGKKMTVKYGSPKKGSIFLTLSNADTTLGKEGYTLDINDAIIIKANTSLGCFWGTRTVLQLLEQSSSIPKGIARDYPKYERRGFMLDVGRKFFTIDFLRQYVKFMAYYKLNEFHIHLNDNGFKKFFSNSWDSTYSAFRLESTTFPGLATKDGHYTKQEFIDLQKLASQYGVNIVPEIDAPAHTLAFAHYMPEIGSKQFGMDHLDLDNPKTYEFMDALFKEYLSGPNPVFTGKEVHIGTDEYSNKVAEKFRAFTDRYIRYVESFGKRARVWGALTHAKGTTPVKSENVIMDAWYNGYADPAEMINLGYDLISIPDGLVYIVPAAGYYYDYLNDEWLFNNWEPIQIGKEVFPYGHPQILGGKFAVWNDHMGNGISEKDVHHRVLASMKVLGQKMWTGNSNEIEFNTFTDKAEQLSEAPGVNMEGKIKAKGYLALSYTFDSKRITDKSGNGNNAKAGNGIKVVNDGTEKCVSIKGGSTIKLPITEIGYGYTVSFKVKRSEAASGTILFQSPNAILWLSEGKSGKLGFSRDGYTYTFSYTVPVNQWSAIAIQGDSKGTTLFVDGKLVERLEGKKFEFNGGMDKMACIQTLVFPLETIGAKQNKETFLIGDLKVYNKTLSVDEMT
ncbi:family 20 glycosylhydrolase [Acetobacteroides hydrogenigenes]|uniref:Hexosaminidase n=1 Tax=Acetobacteroides hydrogenigenes TaxID=979970 RepID=A0A4R2EMR4_9BACT|nr:family 20 glycosylhydrolase [Acetobacteroides hydrogenigenes]TCN70113.1 hexosaminidase [Acetobacteroides hydrogenigenes]